MEWVRCDHIATREKPIHMRRNKLLEQGESLRLSLAIIHSTGKHLAAFSLRWGCRNRHEARQQCGHLHPGEPRFALPLQDHDQVNAIVGDMRETTAAIDSLRRQHGKDLALKDMRQCLPLLRAEPVVTHDLDAGVLQRGKGLVRHAVGLAIQQFLRELMNRPMHLYRCSSIRPLLHDARSNLPLDASDPDHKELVEVGRKDGRELYTLKQGGCRLTHFLEHTSIELKPAELPVDVELRLQRGHA